MLLHYAGEEVFDIYDSFTDEKKGPADGYETLVASLNSYFQPKVNTDFETFQFRQYSQSPSETMDSYYTRLRLQAAKCESLTLLMKVTKA